VESADRLPEPQRLSSAFISAAMKSTRDFTRTRKENEPVSLESGAGTPPSATIPRELAWNAGPRVETRAESSESLKAREYSLNSSTKPENHSSDHRPMRTG